jgi:hypothetical protein
MVGGHDSVIAKVQLGSETFTRGELGSMLKELVPTLTAHRERAYTVLGQIGPARTATGGSGTEMGGSGSTTQPMTPPTK